jgi:outer membrane protein OmpA-like peptidoglycan-associated protein
VLVVLLPDTEDGKVGKIVVSNRAGSRELTSAWASTRVSMNGRPPAIRSLKESEVMRRFGDILATLPPPPRHFTLPFRFDSEELTDEGKRQVQDVLQAVKSYPVPEIVVIGHTDTGGTPQSNIELGFRRANAVRTLLIDAGLNAAAIDVRSHGEAELLVQTSDGVFEPRNRRVEITVR